MLIYWNKRKFLHKKRVLFPRGSLGTPTWPSFHWFGIPICLPWRHVKTLYLCRRDSSKKAARGIVSLNILILFCSLQLKRSKGLKSFDLDESVSEAISSTMRYKLTPDGAVPIEVSIHED